jgi:mercuric ion binding protein
MKTHLNILSLIVAFVATTLFTTTLSAKPLRDETSTFKVYGNCTMCKSRIETALLKNKNIKKATWDVNTKMLIVVYDPQLIGLDNIHKIVADAGHDTDKVKANDKVYKSIPKCCQYRK